MEPSQNSFNFGIGDYVSALGQEAKIVDILRSDTGRCCIYIRFARNFGNARSYDMMDVTGNLLDGVMSWQKITRDEYLAAIKKRLDVLQKELIDG